MGCTIYIHLLLSTGAGFRNHPPYVCIQSTILRSCCSRKRKVSCPFISNDRMQEKSLFEVYLISRVCWKLSVSVLFLFSLQPSMMIPTAGHGSLIHPHAKNRRPISQIYPMHIPKKSPLPSGYLLHSHGKIHHFWLGKPSISMGHLYHGYVK